LVLDVNKKRKIIDFMFPKSGLRFSYYRP